MKNQFIASLIVVSTFINFKVYTQIKLSNQYLPNKFLSYKKSMVSEPIAILSVNKKEDNCFFQMNSTFTKFEKTFKFPKAKANLVAVAANGFIWMIENGALQNYSLANGSKINSYPIPENVTFSHIQKAFDETFFALDSLNNKIYRFHNQKWEVIFEGNKIANSNCITLEIGNLYVGTNNSVKVISISNNKIETIATDLPNVKEIEVDYSGNLIVLANESLLKISLNGDKQSLIKVKGIIDFTYNPIKNKIFTVDVAGNIAVIDYLKFTNESKAIWQKNQKRNMKPFDTKNMILVGSEYYIVTKNDKNERIEIELDGYYPEKGIFQEGFAASYTPSARAMACAEKSYLAFKKWSANLPANFKETTKKTPPMFWLMVNDYSNMKGGQIEKTSRPNASVWYWKREPVVTGRVPGYWKWEATLNQDCQCEIPNEKQAQEFINEYLKTNN